MTLDAPDFAALAASYRTQADELERVARQTAAALREAAARLEARDLTGGPAVAAEGPRIVPDALYEAKEAATILGLAKRPKTIYSIPEAQLVPTWVGPSRGKKMFRGADLLAYMERGRRKM
jgi:hypothetical protein